MFTTDKYNADQIPKYVHCCVQYGIAQYATSSKYKIGIT